ncbi:MULTISPECIES: aminodeoxychorismate/anthranilate synthase component II [unclassified Beijerinckia]|uniref:anthranilate synthase component II n=1 Tax=unclassified Beijerinckia TaxID=2638183 RepID=UPI00089CCBCB|nr:MULTISPECIES: aminodeoxychorismate/anthranilate synthase component II [unclassified Beijerinckia]MDH7794819.1 anthranilate synthase component 2 [Beijerinckia sp. GAS462]SEB76447.1 anthranilate synthase component 2 [Beijerinckia sp. 28-YEA-48]
MPSVTLIDNYDSFTWNLVHYLGSLGASVTVHRNDQISVAAVMAAAPDAIVLSPGPCTPREAGICLDLVAAAGETVPLLGVCLGHQTIGEAFGGEVVRAPTPIHGKLSEITHSGAGLFRGINGPFQATRYHSLVVRADTLPSVLEATAWTDNLIMALQHRSLPIHGVQFHPESILSEHGHLILKNFLDMAGDWNARGRAAHQAVPTQTVPSQARRTASGAA